MKYLLLIIIFLFKKSNEEFNLIIRLENAVKFMISSLENIKGINKTFTLRYPKYKITFSNFRIISPILDNITINENDINSLLFTFDNITFGFFFDILFSFKYERNIYKKDYYLNTTISSIKFKYNNNNEYLSFDSFGDINSDEDSNLIKTNLDIEILDFFKEFKEKKMCLCKKDRGEYQYLKPNIFIYNILQTYIKDYITNFQALNMIITYDAYMIFNSTLKIINCTDEIIKYLKINKIIIPSNAIQPQEQLISKIWIKQIEFIGVYYSLINNKENNFRFNFDQDGDNFVSLFNGKIKFNAEKLSFYCQNCKKEEKKAIEFIIKNDYQNLLEKACQNYYKGEN